MNVVRQGKLAPISMAWPRRCVNVGGASARRPAIPYQRPQPVGARRRLPHSSLLPSRGLLIGCLVVLSLPVLVVGGPDPDPVLATCRGVIDVAVLADGIACLLESQGGPKIVKPGEWKATPLAAVPGEGLTFLRVFAGTDAKTLLRVVALTPQTVPVVYAWRDGAWVKEGELPTPYPKPQDIYKLRCFQDKSGAVWIGYHVEMVYRVADGKVESRDISAGGGNPQAGGHNWMVPGFSESNDGTIAIHHQVGQFGACDPSPFVTSYRAGTWTDTKHGLSDIGAGCFLGNTFLVAQNKSLLHMQFDPSVTITNAAPESADKQVQYAMFLRPTADGGLVSIWGGAAWVYYIAPPYENGFVTRIAEWKDGMWTDPDVGADRSFWDHYRLERPWCEDDEGGMWIGTAAGGVLHRARDGKWTRLNWQRGVRVQTPTRLAIDGKGLLWVVDVTGVCDVIDAKVAFAMAPDAASPWSEEWLCTQWKERADGIRYAMSAEQGGSLIVIGPDGRKVIPMDPGHMRLESANVVSHSDEDGFWVFEGLGDQLTEHYDGKKWERFGKERWNELQQRVVQRVRQAAQPVPQMMVIDGRAVLIGQPAIVNPQVPGVAAPASAPGDCPIPTTEQIWCRQQDGWTWVGGRDTVACTPGEGWVTIPTKRSPLDGRTAVKDLFRDPQGRWWFWIEGRYGHYAVYQPRKVKLEAQTANLGKIAEPNQTLKLGLQCEVPLDGLVLRARLDDGAWAAYATDKGFTIGTVTRGKHKITVDGLGKTEMVAAGPVMFEFESTFDAEAAIDAWIVKLGDPSHKIREQATKDLISVGKPAIEAVRKAATSEDPEVAGRAKEVLKTIDPKPGNPDTAQPMEIRGPVQPMPPPGANPMRRRIIRQGQP